MSASGTADPGIETGPEECLEGMELFSTALSGCADSIQVDPPDPFAERPDGGLKGGP